MTKSVTIELTTRQRQQMEQVTGRKQTSINVQVAARAPLAPKATPRPPWLNSDIRGNGPIGSLPVA